MPSRTLHEWTTALLAATLAAGNLLLGTFLILGNNERFTAPSFVHIVSLAGPPIWGLAFFASGLLALAGQTLRLHLLAKIGHSLSAGMCLWWAGTFAYAATDFPTASLTGIAAYATLGVLHCVAAPVASPPPRR